MFYLVRIQDSKGIRVKNAWKASLHTQHASSSLGAVKSLCNELVCWYIDKAGSECFFELSFCISLYPTIPTIVSLKNLFLPSCHLPSRPWKRELKRPSWKLGSSEFRLPRSTRIVLAQRSLRWHKTFTHPKGKRAGRMIDPHRSPRFADHRMSRMNLAFGNSNSLVSLWLGSAGPST